MNGTTIAVELPVAAYNQLHTLAMRQRKTVPEVVRDLVLQDLPGLPALPENVEAELASFVVLSDELLWMVARSSLDSAQQLQLASLNWKAQQGPLSAEEKAQQQNLVDAYDRMLVRRAQAAAVLSGRGYDLSDPAVLWPE